MNVKTATQIFPALPNAISAAAISPPCACKVAYVPECPHVMANHQHDSKAFYEGGTLLVERGERHAADVTRHALRTP